MLQQRRVVCFLGDVFNMAKYIYPPGSKCEALRLRVHLISLMVFQDPLLNPKTFLFILMVNGGGPLFGSLNLTKIGQQVAYRQVVIATRAFHAQRNSYGFRPIFSPRGPAFRRCYFIYVSRLIWIIYKNSRKSPGGIFFLLDSV